MDLGPLENEITFGVNCFYRTGLITTYYGVSDLSVWKQTKHNLAKIDTQFFLADGAAQSELQIPMVREPVMLSTDPTRLRFQKDPMNGSVYIGRTVIYDICLQLCYYMGFDEVYLIGVDCDYSGEHHFDGSPAAILAHGAKGKWARPFAAYRLAKEVFEEDGRKIYNATVGGKLEIFERVDYDKVIQRQTQR